MPELPEVETLRRQLEPVLLHQRIESAWAVEKVKYSTAAGCVGSVVTGLDRRGKYLILGLDDGFELVIHLGMTGKLLWNVEEGKHLKVKLGFKTGTLTLEDPRGFGGAHLIQAGEYSSLATLNSLGQEPLSANFDVEKAVLILLKGGTAIKGRLLEQKAIAGVGNYIADETLFRAKIHPARTTVTPRGGEAPCAGGP